MCSVAPLQTVNEPIGGQLVFLGTGTSHGVPVIGCGCETCTSEDRRNHRTRCAVAVGLPEGNLLIDAPPELRLQLLRERIGLIHAVAFTHAHADHLFGLDDLRIFPRYLGCELPVYCRGQVESRIRRSFDYAFDPAVQAYPAGGIPRLTFQSIDSAPFDVLGARIIPIPLEHGCYESLGFRVGNVAYCTDVKTIPTGSEELLADLDVLILDCLRDEKHVSHMNFEESMAAIAAFGPKRAFLTHLCHRLEHEATTRRLPPGVELAYDGLRILLT
jgi:phosphoribosyl 1,2-cyclic phosphate phosphodiesterase